MRKDIAHVCWTWFFQYRKTYLATLIIIFRMLYAMLKSKSNLMVLAWRSNEWHTVTSRTMVRLNIMFQHTIKLYSLLKVALIPCLSSSPESIYWKHQFIMGLNLFLIYINDIPGPTLIQLISFSLMTLHCLNQWLIYTCSMNLLSPWDWISWNGV